ncbi:hypothetical protein [Vibrio sp. R78045]|uniref:hypothetical protein n=1 Tax=Vibrio sp. R78045 TaxID=3093868 RepID=UPI0036F3EEB9
MSYIVTRKTVITEPVPYESAQAIRFDSGLHLESFGTLLIVSFNTHVENLETQFKSALAYIIYDPSGSHGGENLIEHIKPYGSDVRSLEQFNESVLPKVLKSLHGHFQVMGRPEGELILNAMFDYMRSPNGLPVEHTRTNLNIRKNDPNRTWDRIPVAVSTGFDGLTVSVDGYETLTGDAPIFLEHYQGVLRLLVWADPEQEDHTHLINLKPNQQG